MSSPSCCHEMSYHGSCRPDAKCPGTETHCCISISNDPGTKSADDMSEAWDNCCVA